MKVAAILALVTVIPTMLPQPALAWAPSKTYLLFQQATPFALSLTYGSTSGGPVPVSSQQVNSKSNPAIIGRMVAYPGSFFILSDTRVQLWSGTLANLGMNLSPTEGTGIDQNVGVMLKIPAIGMGHVQPFLGIRSYLDWTKESNMDGRLFVGPSAGLLSYIRRDDWPIGFFAKTTVSNFWIEVPLGRNAGYDLDPPLLYATELGLEYQVSTQVAATLALNIWQTPSGYTMYGIDRGRAAHTGLSLGVLF